MSKNYKLASSTWGEEEINAMQGVIDSGLYSMGEHVLSYEKNFANYFDSKYCIMTSSGSTVNLLMIASLFFTRIWTISFRERQSTFRSIKSTTYFPLQQYGLKVKFVDIDEETLNLIRKLKRIN